jgi:signal transduction histidine kinase
LLRLPHFERLGLGGKLLISYLAVIAIAAGVLLFVAVLVAPLFFHEHALEMEHAMGGQPEAGWLGELENGFYGALSRALMIAGLVTLPVAIVASAFVSRRIATPLQRVSQASTRIAAGRYAERLPQAGHDEIGELSRSFNRMAAALEATEARRVELIGTVAHELRTPLAGMRGYAEGLQDGVFQPERAAPAIIREVSRLERLVADLSLLSRAEAGAIQFNPTAVELGRLADEVATRMRPSFEAKGLTLSVVEESFTEAWADEDRLTQVLVNLLGNALRHTAEGGVMVLVEERGSRAVIEVRDSGEGIAAEDLPLIFDRFYRADKSRSRDDEGTVGAGVGLTVSRHLVQAMGGELTAESDGPGLGAAFVIQMPMP